MTYEETLDFLFSQLPIYQREGKAAYKANLDNTLALMEALDDPHQKFKSIHIAGTNGKGTSAHALAAILQLAGYKVGLYTSPHLKSFTERVKINGQEIPQKSVVKFVAGMKESIEIIRPSFFEMTVALAFDYFAQQQVDIAVIETGLGGRLDSTNVLLPEVSLITNIGLDHTQILGNTISAIAREKAGIIKLGVPVVLGDMHEEALPVMQEVATKHKAKLLQSRVSEVGQEVPDGYASKNFSAVVAVITELIQQGWQIDQQHISEGLSHYAALTGLKGRYQTIAREPLTIADVSHNPDGLGLLFDDVERESYERLHIVFGTVKDKELAPLFQLLPDDAMLYFTEANVPRSLPAEELKAHALAYGRVGNSYTNVNDALQAAKSAASSADMILITGSTFVVAELEEL